LLQAIRLIRFIELWLNQTNTHTAPQRLSQTRGIAQSLDASLVGIFGQHPNADVLRWDCAIHGSS
jgi:hypothetical protein